LYKLVVEKILGLIGMLNPVLVIKKLVSRDKKPSYVLGRFSLVRDTYSSCRMLLQLLRLRQSVEAGKKESLFNKTAINEINEELRSEAVFLGLNLPAKIVESITSFAKHTPLTREDDSSHFFYNDVKNGYLSDGRPVPQAIASNPLDCDEIQHIVNDPFLLEVVSKYLRYRPSNIHPVLKWSFIVRLPDADRIKLHQTVHYHYDVHGFNFIYANFYLLDTDENSGAHMMIKASHRQKPLWMLLNSAMQPEHVLHNYYGKESELIVKGKSGYGFIQDASCYHKALKPVKKERLMLQIRYW